MLRHRLVRQSAMNISSGSDSSTIPSPQLVRRRRKSQDSEMLRQLSSESMDNLLGSPVSSSIERRAGARRHSVACGVLYVDTQRPSFKSAFNSAVRKMSSACSVLSSAPSSTFNLSPSKKMEDEDEVILPHVLGTFQKSHMPIPPNCTFHTRSTFHVNRRFSSDCPPPSYLEVSSSAWKQPAVVTQQKLTRQQELLASNGSLRSVDDDDVGNFDGRLVN